MDFLRIWTKNVKTAKLSSANTFFPYINRFCKSLFQDGTCHYSADNVGATDTGFVDIKKGDENDLKMAVATVGPVAVAIDASHFSFQFYHSGVYDPWLCSSTSLDHGVLAVGYGTESGKDYWLVKNRLVTQLFIHYYNNFHSSFFY